MVLPLPVVPLPDGPLADGDDGLARSVEPRAEPAAAGEPVPPEAPALFMRGWLVARSQQCVCAVTLPWELPDWRCCAPAAPGLLCCIVGPVSLP